MFCEYRIRMVGRRFLCYSEESEVVGDHVSLGINCQGPNSVLPCIWD